MGIQHLHRSSLQDHLLKNPFTVLLLSAACAFGQCSFTFDIASFPGVATNPPAPPCTNEVVWYDQFSTLDWYDTNGNPHYTVNNFQFQTNCPDEVQKIDAQGFLGNYITNIPNGMGSLTNLAILQIGTENGLTAIDLNGLYSLTNVAINYNPDITSIDFGADGVVNPVNFNVSQNPALNSIFNYDAGGLSMLASYIINNCNFSDETMTNIACYVYSQIVANNLSNGTFYCQANAESIADPSCIWAMTNYGWTINY